MPTVVSEYHGGVPETAAAQKIGSGKSETYFFSILKLFFIYSAAGVASGSRPQTYFVAAEGSETYF